VGQRLCRLVRRDNGQRERRKVGVTVVAIIVVASGAPLRPRHPKSAQMVQSPRGDVTSHPRTTLLHSESNFRISWFGLRIRARVTRVAARARSLLYESVPHLPLIARGNNRENVSLNPRASLYCEACRMLLSGRRALMKNALSLVGAVLLGAIACSGTSSQSNDGITTIGGAPSMGGAPASSSGGANQNGGSSNAAGGNLAATGGAANTGGANSPSSGGSSSGTGDANSPSTAGSGQLASNLDANICTSVTYVHNGPNETAQRKACQLCCNGAQYDSFGTYNGTCMCGTRVPANTTICPQSTAEVCATCCHAAGYAMGNGTSAACFCYGTTTLCASAAGNSEACLNCCTEHGYMAWGSSSNPLTCTCDS